MASTSYPEIRDSLRQLYVDDPRPWLVGFSGGKDSTLVAALVFRHPLRLDRGEGRVRCRAWFQRPGSLPPEQRTKPVTVLCTDTRGDRNGHKRAQRSQRRTVRSLYSVAASPFRTLHSEIRTCPANRLRELQEQIAAEKGIRAEALRRLLAKVDEFSESVLS